MTEQEDINNARNSTLAANTFSVLEIAHQEGVGELVAAKLGEIVGLIYATEVPAYLSIEAYQGSIKNMQPVKKGDRY